MNSKAIAVGIAAIVACAALPRAQDYDLNVPQRVRRTIGRVLPEKSNASAPFASQSYTSTLTFTAPATVRVVFLRGRSSYQNSLGYFTYVDNQDGTIQVTSADIIKRNTANWNFSPGDAYDLKTAGGTARTFAAGEKVGFFLVADGNRAASGLMDAWTFGYSDALGTVPSPDPAVNDRRGRGCYTSIARANPEWGEGHADRSKHIVMLEMPGVPGFLDGGDYLLCGVEDLRRSGNSDDDFNDLVFAVDVSPATAIDRSGIFRYQPGDPDGDGVRGVNDAFPNDPQRASIRRFPSAGHNVIAFEDKYPGIGDADYNDAVFAYVFEVVKDRNGRVKDILSTWSLIGRGAAYDHALGLHLPGLPPAARGTIDVERFASGSNTSVVVPQRTVQALIQAGTRRIDDVFASTIAALPPPAGYEFSNTLFAPGFSTAASARVHIEFEVAIDEGPLGQPPYDTFLIVDNPNYPGVPIDIHLPGWPSLPDRPPLIGPEVGAKTFLDANGYPWAIEVPNDWRFPMENVPIGLGYPTFLTWVATEGASGGDWYLFPESSSGLVGPSLSQLIAPRDWSIDIPGR